MKEKEAESDLKEKTKKRKNIYKHCKRKVSCDRTAGDFQKKIIMIRKIISFLFDIKNNITTFVSLIKQN